MPDWRTLRRCSWHDKTALVLCDAKDEHTGELLDVAPRTILRAQVDQARRIGFEVMAATELEYYAYKTSYTDAKSQNYMVWRRDDDMRGCALHGMGDGMVTCGGCALQGLPPLSGYVEDYSLQLASREEAYHGAFRRHLRRSGVPVESSKGEAGPGQHELNVRYCEALTMADRTAVYKQCIKEVADQQGIAVTFMAKPVAAEAGSSCHVHISLRRLDGKPAFYSPDVPLWHGLQATDEFKWFLGGLLQHAADVLPWMAPTVNSYRRYNTGHWAPTRLAWTPDNRTTAFRVVGEAEALRIEARVPGADANPYLALAALIGSGLQGIRSRLDPGAPFTGNAYAAQQLPRIARSLALATAQMDGSRVARELFGDEVVDHYVHFYDNEEEAFQRAVTDWELKRYFERI